MCALRSRQHGEHPGSLLVSADSMGVAQGRAKALARLGVKIASVFPLEADAYRRAGADVRFVGILS